MSTASELAELQSLVSTRFAQSIALPQTFFEAEAGRIAEACWTMARRFHQGGRLLAFGQGPSATDAQHVAVEFVHPVIVGKRALPALALSMDHISSGPASDPDRLFSRQLKALARPWDIAMGFSLEGDCTSVLEALTTARQMGLLTLALTGAQGERLRDAQPAFGFCVPSDDPLVIQETHEMLYHVLWELVHIFFEHAGLLEAGQPERVK